MMYLYKINEPKFLQQSPGGEAMNALLFFHFVFPLVSRYLRSMQAKIWDICVVCPDVSVCC